MGMWPTATLTYGFDIENPTGDWAEDDEPVETAGALLRDAGVPDNIRVWQDYDGQIQRLYAVFFQAAGHRYKDAVESIESLEIPDGSGLWLHRAAEILGVDLGDAKPSWQLVGEFN